MTLEISAAGLFLFSQQFDPRSESTLTVAVVASCLMAASFLIARRIARLAFWVNAACLFLPFFALCGFLFSRSSLRELFLNWPILQAIAACACLGGSVFIFLCRPLRFWRALCFALSLVFVSGLQGLAVSPNPEILQALTRSPLLDRAFLWAEKLTDGDGDGVSSWFGGKDCDDTNPDIYPGAHDIPGNGIDEDCFEGDAPMPEPEPEPEPEKPTTRVLKERPNIVHITIDALRADHLGYHGYPRPTSPNIDAFANRSMRFYWAFSQGSQTRSSVPSTITGHYISELHHSPEDWAIWWSPNVMIAERLRDAGYLTAGIMTHRYFLHGYGLSQGFEDWDQSLIHQFGQSLPDQVADHLVVAKAIQWLDAYEKKTADATEDATPFYLWVYCFDPHYNYQPHNDLNALVAPEIDYSKRGSLETQMALYDGEIRFTDQQLGLLFDRLSKPPFADNTYIFLHSDHAEGFEEHGYRHHGQNLFNDQIHVPLLLSGPGIEPEDVMEPVALLDIVPTIETLAGLPHEKLPGRDLLLSNLPNDSTEIRVILSEQRQDSGHSERKTLVRWPWKLHYAARTSSYALYNLQEDPNEQNNLAKQEPETLKSLSEALHKYISETITPKKPYWFQFPGGIVPPKL